MIVRWLIRVCAALLVVEAGSIADSIETVPAILLKRNITEKTGMVCAYADFNQDRLTDVLHYHKGKLYVLLQKQLDFTDEANADTQKLIIDLQEEFAEVACSVGDINNDGFPDIVVSLRKTKGDGEWTVRYFLTEWGKDESDGGKEKVKRFQQGNHAIKAKHQAALVDVTGDGVHDLIGIKADGDKILCLRGDNSAPLQEHCHEIFADEYSGALHPLMPILFGDVDNDLYAELVMMKYDESNGGLKPEIWSRFGALWTTKKVKQLPTPKGVPFLHTLSPLMVDIDLNAKMDFIVPICKDKTCTTIENLQVAEWSCESNDGTPCEEGHWGEWKTVTFDMQGLTIVAEEDTLVRMKAGDANLDGYPDMLVTIGSAPGGNNYAAVIENRPSEDGALTRKFEKPSQMMIMPGLALGMIQSSSFFDFAEDGYLDVLVQWKLRDGDDWQWSLCISEPKEQDVTFLKVQTFAPLDGDIKDGKGVIWGGVCVKYEMETTGIGEKRKAIDCQLPGNSHKAGLSPPFSLFGLGRNPNFIDVATIGVPRSDGGPTGNKIGFMRHEQKQIVPNARMMVQPARKPADSWVLRLYLTPSTLIFSSLIVMASTCTILLVVVLVLHFREKKVDRVERAAQSHRFHFDAM